MQELILNKGKYPLDRINFLSILPSAGLRVTVHHYVLLEDNQAVDKNTEHYIFNDYTKDLTKKSNRKQDIAVKAIHDLNFSVFYGMESGFDKCYVNSKNIKCVRVVERKGRSRVSQIEFNSGKVLEGLFLNEPENLPEHQENIMFLDKNK